MCMYVLPGSLAAGILFAAAGSIFGDENQLPSDFTTDFYACMYVCMYVCMYGCFMYVCMYMCKYVLYICHYFSQNMNVYE